MQRQPGISLIAPQIRPRWAPSVHSESTRVHYRLRMATILAMGAVVMLAATVSCSALPSPIVTPEATSSATPEATSSATPDASASLERTLRPTETAANRAFERAVRLALADPLLSDYLSRHAHSKPVAERYRHPPEELRPIPAIFVSLRFESYADDYPLGSCDVNRPIDRVIGVAWMVDISEQRILARTPIWPPDVRCF